MAGCIDRTGVDWDGYRAAVGLECVPATPSVTAGAFVSTLSDVIEKLLRVHSVTIWGADIFHHRTGRDAQDRMTLQRAGEALGAFA